MPDKLAGRNIEEAFHKIYETPELVKPWAYKIVTEEEEALIRFLAGRPKSAAEVAGHFGISPEEAARRLASAYHRANIHKSRENNELYMPATLYDRLGYFTQYEQEAWRTIPEGERAKIDVWYVEAFAELMKQRIEEQGDRFHRDAVMPIETAIKEIADIYEEKQSPYYVVPCNCRTTANLCDFSRDTCVANNRGANTQWDRGYGREVTLGELNELMRAADKEGLMHTVDRSGHICNCDTCCCYEFRGAGILGSKGLWPRVPYVAAFDAEKCVNCGLCAKRCHFGAFSRGAGGRIGFDPSLCWGCGICETACPASAIRTVPLPASASAAPAAPAAPLAAQKGA
ncbi:MAG: 4Fe-4S binding protein [Clostridiales Family XIII bacterium]|jgi:ferredoxin|nr:4Fe-4S binding protein [Clostridiales Family XIII bacterium]